MDAYEAGSPLPVRTRLSGERETATRTEPKAHTLVGCFGVWLLFMIFNADAAQVRVTLPTGERYVGEWLGGDAFNYRLRLSDGKEIAVSVEKGGVVEFDSQDPDAVPVEAAMRLKAAADAFELGLTQSGEQALRDAVTIAPRYARAHYELARFLDSRGQKAEAYRHFLLASRLDSKTYPIGLRARQAAAEAVSRQAFGEAAAILTQFAESLPDEPDAPQAAYDALAHFARQYEETPKKEILKEAIDAATFAVGRFPTFPKADEMVSRLGNFYQRAEQPENVLLTLESFPTRFPKSPLLPQVRFTLAVAYAKKKDTPNVEREARWVLQNAKDPALRDRARALLTEHAWTVLTAEEKFSGSEVRAVARDNKVLWVGTSDGVAKFFLGESGLIPIEEGKPDLVKGTVVRSLVADEKELWIGSTNKGVIRYNKRTAKTDYFTRLDGLPTNNIVSVAMTEDEVWVGGTGGVARFNRITSEWTPFPARLGTEFNGREVTCIGLTPFSVWVGTAGQGVYRYDRLAAKWEVFNAKQGLGSDKVRSLAVLETGVVAGWYSADENGYSEWNPLSRRWSSLPLGPDEIAPQDIYVAFETATLWVATGETLLFRMPNGSWGNVDYPTALRSARINGIFPDNEIIWIGTSDGLGGANLRLLGAANGQQG